MIIAFLTCCNGTEEDENAMKLVKGTHLEILIYQVKHNETGSELDLDGLAMDGAALGGLADRAEWISSFGDALAVNTCLVSLSLTRMGLDDEVSVSDLDGGYKSVRYCLFCINAPSLVTRLALSPSIRYVSTLRYLSLKRLFPLSVRHV